VSNLPYISATSTHYGLLCQVSAYPKVEAELFLADAEAIKVCLVERFPTAMNNPAEKEVTSSRYRFPKPIYQYTVLLFFGSNIVASEGEEWKKFRKISAPAFSDVRHLSKVEQIESLIFGI